MEKFYVLKESGTYSNALEAYGLAELLRKVNTDETNILIEDKGMYYQISLLNPTWFDFEYFDLFPYLKTKEKVSKKKEEKEGEQKLNKLEASILNYIDLEEEKAKNKRYKEFVETIRKQKKDVLKNNSSNPEISKTLIRSLDKRLEEYEEKPRNDWDILSGIIVLKAADTYKKIYLNLFQNKKGFAKILECIFTLYKTPDDNRETIKNLLQTYKKNKIIANVKDADCLQLYNPSMVKGAHAPKANSITPKAKNGFWLNECMKILGSFNGMIVKSVKISKKDWDMKIYVLDIRKMEWSGDKRKIIFNKFKESLKGNTSIKLDINSILCLTKTLIEYHKQYISNKSGFKRKYRPKEEINGLFTAYFKKMGNASSPSNISYLELPLFIEINSYNDAEEWLEIIDEHLSVINNIRNAIDKQDESGNIISILQSYRMFLTTGDINYFFDFASTYSVFLMQQIANKNFYVRYFDKKLMEVFLMKCENRLANILNNEGFRNIAKAIRNSTISEQYAKSKGHQLYEIRYGLAQDLIRKSAYKDELVEFLCEFIVSYNQENARFAEKDKHIRDKGKRRATIKQQDMEELIKLIDEYDSALIGKMLCAYGYCLDRKADNEQIEQHVINDNYDTMDDDNVNG